MWRTVKLGDVIEKTETINPTTKLPNDSFEYIDVSSVSKERLAIEETQTLLGKDAPSRARRRVLEDDVIFATVRPTLKRVAIVPRELSEQICSTGYIVLRGKKDVLLPRYLFHWMTSQFVMDYVETVQTGASYPAVTDKQVKEIDIRIPPLAEQQRIVAKLDAAFAGIDRAIEINKERYKEVKTLIAKSQNQLFLSISTAASVMRLGDVAKFENGDRGKNYPSKKYQIEEGIPFVNAGDFSLDGEIETESIVYISEERFDLLGAGKFTIDDVLFCLRGSLGKSAINKSIEVGAIASSLVILRAKKNIISSDYLFAYIRSDIVKNLIEQTAGGAAQPNLSAKVVSNYEIPVPPMEEQQRLSDKFWLFRQKGSDVLDSISQKSQRLNALKAAILAQELNPSEAA